jgi:hypothetical protein
LWRRGAAWHDPKLNTILFTETAIQNDDAGEVDPTLTHQIISRSSTKSVGLAYTAGAATVSEYVSSGRLIVLKFNREVVETGLLIVERAIATNVKLPDGVLSRSQSWNESRSLDHLPAGGLS